MTTDTLPDWRGPALVGGAWALLALVAMVLVFGGPDQAVHQSPDEAAMARAVRLVEASGRPTEPVAFDDPAGLNHQRIWVRADGATLPAYPPVPMLVQGFARRVPLGDWLLLVLPAAGLGAAVTALGLSLRDRWWLAGLAPGLAFPATYWWLRPWHNTSQMLGMAGLAALAAAVFVRTRRPWAGVATIALATLAAAFRPDQVHLLLGLSLVAGMVAAREPRERWQWLGAHVVAGIAWVGLNVVGNLATTGAALTSSIDLLEFPDEIRSAGQDLPFPLPQLTIILARRGVPDPAAVVEHVRRYLIAWGPILFLTVPAVTGLAVGAWRTRRRLRTPAVASAWAVTAVLGWYAISRVSSTDFGTKFSGAGMSHSFPRYTALVFVGLAVAAVVGVSRIRMHRTSLVAIGLLAIGAVAGGAYATIDHGDDETLTWLAGHVDDATAYGDALDAQAPADAFVYVWKSDKHVWHVRPVGLIQVEQPGEAGRVDIVGLAQSSAAALDAGFRPLLTELTTDEARAVQERLADLGLTLATTSIDLPALAGTLQAPVYEVVAGADGDG